MLKYGNTGVQPERGPAPTFQPAPMGDAANRVAPPPIPAHTAPAADGIMVALSRPLTTHQGNVKTLTVRAPTLSDYIELGDIDTPIATDFENGVATTLRAHTDRAALMRWAVALTGLDGVVLGLLGAADAGKLFEAVRTAVLPFTRGNSQSAPTNSSSSSDSTPNTSSAPL